MGGVELPLASVAQASDRLSLDVEHVDVVTGRVFPTAEYAIKPVSVEVSRASSDAVPDGAVGVVPSVEVESGRDGEGSSHSATVRLADSLEGAGMLQRAAGPDRRTTSLVLTPAGEATVSRLRDNRLAALRGFVDALDAGQREALIGAVEELLHGRVVQPIDAWRICRLCDVERCVVPSCPVLDAATPLLEGPS